MKTEEGKSMEKACDAMGHYGGEKPEGICPKCGEPWKSPEAARHHQSPVADDPFIQKHLKIIMGKTADAMIQMNIEKMWGGLEMASVQFFIDTGKINGNFHIRLKEMMIKFAERWHTTAALPEHPSSLTGDAVKGKGGYVEAFRKLREVGSAWNNIICVCRGLMRDNPCECNCKEFHDESLSNYFYPEIIENKK